MNNNHRDIFVNMSQVLRHAEGFIQENINCRGVMCEECPCNIMGICEVIQMRQKIEMIVKRCDEFITAQEEM